MFCLNPTTRKNSITASNKPIILVVTRNEYDNIKTCFYQCLFLVFIRGKVIITSTCLQVIILASIRLVQRSYLYHKLMGTKQFSKSVCINDSVISKSKIQGVLTTYGVGKQSTYFAYFF